MNGKDEGTGERDGQAQNARADGRAERAIPTEGCAEQNNPADECEVRISPTEGDAECNNPADGRASARRLRWTGKEYALLEEDPCMYGWRGMLQRKAAGITDTDPEAMYRDTGDGFVWFGACRMRAEEAAAIPDVDDSVPDELDPAWTGYLAYL